jgi:hypothetical protein
MARKDGASLPVLIDIPARGWQARQMMSTANTKSPNHWLYVRRFTILAAMLTLELATALTGCKGGPVSQPSLAGGRTASGRAAGTGAATSAGRADNDCLSCHGPFDKLIEVTAKYVAPSGEKTSPHRYVPHDSKLGKDVPECTHCHTAHPLSPLPASGSIDLSKVSVEWCYTCHHEKNFTSCKECHP